MWLQGGGGEPGWSCFCSCTTALLSHHRATFQGAFRFVVCFFPLLFVFTFSCWLSFLFLTCSVITVNLQCHGDFSRNSLIFIFSMLSFFACCFYFLPSMLLFACRLFLVVRSIFFFLCYLFRVVFRCGVGACIFLVVVGGVCFFVFFFSVFFKLGLGRGGGGGEFVRFFLCFLGGHVLLCFFFVFSTCFFVFFSGFCFCF